MYFNWKVSLCKNPRFLTSHFLPLFISSIAFLFSAKKAHTQELHLSGGVQFYGEINGGFSGFGLGLENEISRHFSLSGDVNVGYNKIGRAVELRPSVHYYFNQDQKGFYIGPSLKYIILKEVWDLDLYDDQLYAVGFSLGIKTEINEHLIFSLNLSPHKTIGGLNEADVAGISGQLNIGYRL